MATKGWLQFSINKKYSLVKVRIRPKSMTTCVKSDVVYLPKDQNTIFLFVAIVILFIFQNVKTRISRLGQCDFVYLPKRQNTIFLFAAIVIILNYYLTRLR